MSGFHIESSPNIITVIKEVAYDFKDMISKEIAAALTDIQDRRASIDEKVETTGDSLPLGALFQSRRKW